MVLACMLCRTESKIDEVGLFCAVKKSEVVDEEVVVQLRLAFDQRRSNLHWQRPPWCATGGVSAVPFLDVSEGMKGPGAEVRFGARDLPDFYCALDLGEEMAPTSRCPRRVRASWQPPCPTAWSCRGGGSARGPAWPS